MIFSTGDFEKVKELDRLVSLEAGFQKSYPVTGQTYSRLVDCSIISALTLFGAAVHKVMEFIYFCWDGILIKIHNYVTFGRIQYFPIV